MVVVDWPLTSSTSGAEQGLRRWRHVNLSSQKAYRGPEDRHADRAPCWRMPLFLVPETRANCRRILWPRRRDTNGRRGIVTPHPPLSVGCGNCLDSDRSWTGPSMKSRSTGTTPRVEPPVAQRTLLRRTSPINASFASEMSLYAPTGKHAENQHPVSCPHRVCSETGVPTEKLCSITPPPSTGMLTRHLPAETALQPGEPGSVGNASQARGDSNSTLSNFFPPLLATRQHILATTPWTRSP